MQPSRVAGAAGERDASRGAAARRPRGTLPVDVVDVVDVERAAYRARHLRERAMRRPIGSNGRRKDLAAAAALEREARRLLADQLLAGVLETTARR